MAKLVAKNAAETRNIASSTDDVGNDLAQSQKPTEKQYTTADRLKAYTATSGWLVFKE